MILSYRKREDSPIEVSGACPVVKSSSRSSEPTELPRRREKKLMKPFRGFWFNFFRAPAGTNQEKRQSVNLADLIPVPRPATSCSSSSSTESVNTIQSTHSFSFVSAKSYAGRPQHGKRGRRIPVEVEDNSFRQKPQKPQLKGSSTPKMTRAGAGGTLSRIGMRFGLNLKSKYNLQSCESLAVCGTDLPSSQNCPSSHSLSEIPGPSSRARSAAVPLSPFPQRRRQGGRNESQGRISHLNPARFPETKEESQNSINNSIKVKEDITVDLVPKKRRAPPPPATSAGISTLDSSHRKKPECHEPVEVDTRAQQRHRRCQSDTAACDRVKPRLHVRGKRRAPTPPSVVTETEVRAHTQSSQTRTSTRQLPTLAEKEDNMRSKKKLQATNGVILSSSHCHSHSAQIPTGFGLAQEQKPIPRPWYRRNPGKSHTKVQNPKPIINLPNFSNLDREAGQIVEENRRRSAELNYKQTAKELITMFNSTFPKVEENDSPGSKVTESRGRDVDCGAPAGAQADIIRNTTIQEFEEKKKLAIVQPQKSEKHLKEKLSTNFTPVNSVRNLNPNKDFLGSVPVRPSNGIESEQWTCPQCTLNNSSWRAFCDACFFRRGSPFKSKALISQPIRSAVPNPQLTQAVGGTQQNGIPQHTETVAERNLRESEIPPCQNFLHQLPDKENLRKEKMLGVKLLEDENGGELDISALREARVAFFTKNSSAPTSDDFKPNNFNPPMTTGSEFKELNLPLPSGRDEGNDDLEVVDFLLKIHQEAESSPFLPGRTTGSWKSKKYRPIYEAISENNSQAADITDFEKIYEDLRRIVHSKGNDLTNTFMQSSIQSVIKAQLVLYKNVMEDDAGAETEGSMEAMVESYRKQGAVPKHLIQSAQAQGRPRPAGSQSRKEHAQAASDLLRKLDWAISHGEYRLAAKLAYEVATLKVEPAQPKVEELITIRVYVEDRMMQQGPFLVSVTGSMTIGKLKTKIESDWSIPVNFQKWILGKKMAEGDEDLLRKYNIQNESLAFLYLITPEFGNCQEKSDEKTSDNRSDQVRKNSLEENNVKLKVSESDASAGEEVDIKMLNGPATQGSGDPIKSTTHLHQQSKAKVLEQRTCSDVVIHYPTPETSKVFRKSSKIIPDNKTEPKIDNQINFMQNSEFKTYNDVVKSKLEDLPFKNINPEMNSDKMLLTPNPTTILLQAQTNEPSPLGLGANSNQEIHVQNLTRGIPNSTNKTLSGLRACKQLENSAIDQQNSPAGSSSQRRTSSLGESFSKQVVHVPFTRRLSGTLTKQIQMFEALNSPQQVAQTRRKSEGGVEGTVPVGSGVSQVNGASTKGATEKIGRGGSHSARIPVTELQENAENYRKLLDLEKSELVRSEVEVDCPVCLSQVARDQGVILRDCLHSFCQECLAGSIEHSEDAQVKCPYRDKNYACESVLQEREIKALVSIEVFHRLLAKSVKLAECKMSNTFHCQTNDCPGWCVFEDTVNVFRCPVCSKSNCLNCRAIHDGLDCQQYQRQLAIAAETDEDAKSSRLMLEKMIQRGEALDCPACHVVLLKKWGCDWVRCSYCKTEICWVTKSFRWGPNGKGDTSGGCRCGVNGVKCHPKCTYCH